ncbi:hypothetical protein GOBAR_DD09410 [Gossypium barbadense]|nr:hypothetical protein GOBAR_DD09410 [Gossypium barbadense]
MTFFESAALIGSQVMSNWMVGGNLEKEIACPSTAAILTAIVGIICISRVYGGSPQTVTFKEYKVSFYSYILCDGFVNVGFQSAAGLKQHGVILVFTSQDLKQNPFPCDGYSVGKRHTEINNVAHGSARFLMEQAANGCDIEHDSKAQVIAIHRIIGTLQRMNVFGVENRDTLTHKATGYSARLLKKADQCRAVYVCSYLFWVDDQDGVKDEERSGLKTWSSNNKQITSSAIQGLIELIHTEMQSDSIDPNSVADAFLASTLRYIQFQKQKGGVVGEKFDSVKL